MLIVPAYRRDQAHAIRDQIKKGHALLNLFAHLPLLRGSAGRAGDITEDEFVVFFSELFPVVTLDIVVS